MLEKLSMDKPLFGKYVCGEKILVAYLDLCGTKAAYSKLAVEQQVDRIHQVVSGVLEAVANKFNEEERKNIYIHMFSDSLVIAEKSQGKPTNVSALIELLLDVQYTILQNSASSIEYQIMSEEAVPKKLYMPTLSRALVRRGSYYGMVFSEFQQSIKDVRSNFSLVGGLAILEMDEDLCGLPMGTYVESSIVKELELCPNRILGVVGVDGAFKFVKPGKTIQVGPICLPTNPDDMARQLIQMSGNDDSVISKLTPWVDAMQGRRNSIARRIAKERSNS